ncbi:hypothetical protein ABZ793_33890 [Micromonospora sp. NPDC047465]|uniref:hypothetical protein n=1 Tax=Micromonospora sp. NPDC047465 TaxID=3154813 RepID=UPI0033D38F37
MTAVVADADDLAPGQDAARAAWRRNRHSSLVDFRIDQEGRLIAQAWTPKDGLTPAAFQTLVRAVAREADRYEFQLTGSDDR